MMSDNNYLYEIRSYECNSEYKDSIDKTIKQIESLQTQLSQCKREGDRYREALEWVNENSRQTAVRVMVQIALEDTDNDS